MGTSTSVLIALASAIASAVSAFFAGRYAGLVKDAAERAKQTDRAKFEREVVLSAQRVISAAIGVTDLVAEANQSIKTTFVLAGSYNGSRRQVIEGEVENKRKKAESMQFEANELLGSRSSWPNKPDAELAERLVTMEDRLLALARLRDSLIREIDKSDDLARDLRAQAAAALPHGPTSGGR